MKHLYLAMLCALTLVSTEAQAQGRPDGVGPIDDLNTPGTLMGKPSGVGNPTNPVTNPRNVCRFSQAGKGDNGIFLLEFSRSGGVRALKCKGNAPGMSNDAVNEQAVRPSNVSFLLSETAITIRKWIDPDNDTDPCYEYVIGGVLRTVCW